MTGRLPSLKPREVARALREAGFVEYPGKGSHRIYVNEAANRQVVLAWHSREMKRGTLKAIIKQAGFNEDECGGPSGYAIPVQLDSRNAERLTTVFIAASGILPDPPRFSGKSP